MNVYSLRQDGVQTGKWTDYSNGQVIVTLPIRNAGYLIAATAFWITVVGARVWSLEKFFIHSHFASRPRTDGLGVFHRVLVRNAGSEVGMIWDVLKTWWAWKGLRPRTRQIGWRSLKMGLIPVVNVLAFAALSVFSSRIASRSYESAHVLLKPNNCGILAFNLGLNVTTNRDLRRVMLQTAFNNTQAARQYAHNCYQLQFDPGQCSMFPSRSISYSSEVVKCPFGQTPAGKNICQPNAGTALQLTTPSLNTGAIFGINIPAENQIEVKKSLTCSPISVSEYLRTNNAGSDDANTYLELGPIVGGTAYTLVYRSRSKYDNVGYQVFSLDSGGNAIWSPVDALKVRHGDVSVTMLLGNSIGYLKEVKDPWFSANVYDNVTNNYKSDNDLSVVACIDQYQICNPSTGNGSSCTILGSSTDVWEAHFGIGLNKYQTVLADRMLLVLGTGSIWQSIDYEGAGAILASRNLVAFESSGLPDNQWELEVRDWFETSLATMQAAVIQYVNNVNQADLGIYATIARPSAKLTGVPEDYFCNVQRVRNTGAYVSFSFNWIVVIYSVGIALSILSFVPSIWSLIRKNPSVRDVVRTADFLFQIMRKLLEQMEPGNKEAWSRQMGDVPVFESNGMFLLPRLQMYSNDGIRDFLPSRPERSEMLQEVVETERHTDHDEERKYMGSSQFQLKENGQWLPLVTVSEEAEIQSSIDEALDNHRNSRERVGSSYSSISALTN